MDGLASLAAAANLVELVDIQTQHNSPIKRKTSFKTAPSPRKKKKKDDNENEIRQNENNSIRIETNNNNNNINNNNNNSNSNHNETTTTIPTTTTSSEISLLEKLPITLTTNLRLYCIHEWFYPTLDRDYFDENEFMGCLYQLGLQKFTSLPRSKWSYLRCIIGAKIGRPRRFSPSFLLSERDKLKKYRQTIRSVQFGGNPPPVRDFPYQIYDPVDVGDCVTVYHIPTASLQRAQILSFNSYSTTKVEYLVQYDSLELGHGLVSDDLIAIHGDVPIRLRRKRVYEKDLQIFEQDITLNDAINGESKNINELSSENHIIQDPIIYLSPFHQELWNDCVKESHEIFIQALRGSDHISNTTPQLPSLISRNNSNTNINNGNNNNNNSSDINTNNLTSNQQQLDLKNIISTNDDSLLQSSYTNSIIEPLISPLITSLLFLNHLSSTKLEQSNNKFIDKDNIFTPEIQNYIIYKIQEIYPNNNLSNLPDILRSFSQLQVEYPSIWRTNTNSTISQPSPLLPSVFSGYPATTNQQSFTFPSTTTTSSTTTINSSSASSSSSSTFNSTPKNYISNTPLVLSIPPFESSSSYFPLSGNSNPHSNPPTSFSRSNSNSSKE